MGDVVDGDKSWPCSDEQVGSDTITVTIAGSQGFTSVTTGGERQGSVRFTGLQHDVQLPGNSQTGMRQVKFNRKNI